MTLSELKEIISKPESNALEFKKETPKASVLAWYICQFANKEGGRIVVGIDDNKNIVGINPKIVRDALEKSSRLYDGSHRLSLTKLEMIRENRLL